MSAPGPAYRRLLETLGRLEHQLLTSPAALEDPQFEAETYRWLLSITQVALDCYLFADRANPRFVDIVGPTKKWGGDNPDAFYQHAALDPQRTYRITGQRGDAVYLSVTVYGGPDDGRYSERIVGWLNDRQLTFAPDGSFELWLAREPPASGAPWIELADDAVCVLTRDYLEDPAKGRRCAWRIEATDRPSTWRADPEEVARGLAAATTFVEQQAGIVPVALGEPNSVEDPYPVPTTTFGWAAADAAYAMGSFDLADDEVLVLRGTPPRCAFWNLCLWNPYLHTYNYTYERVSINGAQAVKEADGSVVIEVAASPTGHPNYVSTQGHRQGRLWFRWFLPEEHPSRVKASVRRR